jgi:hypothetical protein
VGGKGMRVLVACEYSGRVREAFRQQGHEAWSCDILPADDDSPFHYQGDVMSILYDGWDAMIAHPPCTYLCNSGVSWLYKNEGRWELMREGAEFFKTLYNAPIKHIAIENPIMHKYAKDIIGAKQTQIVQPWMFGHPESKATCLWLKSLPTLKETNNVKDQWKLLPKNQAQRLHHLPPSADRWKLRSETFQGIADAMAQQWGDII